MSDIHVPGLDWWKWPIPDAVPTKACGDAAGSDTIGTLPLPVIGNGSITAWEVPEDVSVRKHRCVGVDCVVYMA